MKKFTHITAKHKYILLIAASSILLIILLCLFFLIHHGREQKAVYENPNPQVMDIKEATDIFSDKVKENEFVGYAVKGTFQEQLYLFGLIYRQKDETFIHTSLEAVVILKGEPPYELVNRCKIDSEEVGSFEEPLGSGSYYRCTTMGENGKIFISVFEPSFSDYGIIHQVLVDNTTCLDFYETTEGSNVFLSQEDAYYTRIGTYWQMLQMQDGKIRYSPVDVTAFRPQAAEKDVILAYEYQNNSPDYPCFTLNGETIEVIWGENCNILNEAITIPQGSLLYLLDTATYPMSLDDDYLLDGQYQALSQLKVTEGIGYRVLDFGDLQGDVSIFLGYYSDFWYEIPLVVE